MATGNWAEQADNRKAWQALPIDRYMRVTMQDKHGKQDGALTGRVYLDNNASAPLRGSAREAVVRVSALAGNPSSVHAEGRAARAELHGARDRLAACFKVPARSVIFTSGATEAAAMALRPGALMRGGAGATGLAMSATEHPCVRQGHGFAADTVEILPVDAHGLLDLERLEALLAARRDEGAAAEGPVLVAVQAANNETGVRQPTAQIGAIARAHGAIFVCDAVQAVGKYPADAASIGADVMFVSAHKFGGPKGVGALILSGEGVELAAPLSRGGGQEFSHRAGTENLIGIAGMAAALDEAIAELDNGGVDRLEGLRGKLEAGLEKIAPEARIFGKRVERLANTTYFAVPGLSAETAVIGFDLAGIAVSSGSACSSGKVGPSHVLAAMGAGDDYSSGAVRVSLGWDSKEEDIDKVLEAWQGIHRSFEQRRHAPAA